MTVASTAPPKSTSCGSAGPQPRTSDGGQAASALVPDRAPWGPGPGVRRAHDLRFGRRPSVPGRTFRNADRPSRWLFGVDPGRGIACPGRFRGVALLGGSARKCPLPCVITRVSISTFPASSDSNRCVFTASMCPGKTLASIPRPSSVIATMVLRSSSGDGRGASSRSCNDCAWYVSPLRLYTTPSATRASPEEWPAVLVLRAAHTDCHICATPLCLDDARSGLRSSTPSACASFYPRFPLRSSKRFHGVSRRPANKCRRRPGWRAMGSSISWTVDIEREHANV